MDARYRVAIQITSVDETIKSADSLLNLAALNSKEAPTLYSCATVIFASALDQGTRAIILSHAINQSVDKALDISTTSAYALLTLYLLRLYDIVFWNYPLCRVKGNIS